MLVVEELSANRFVEFVSLVTELAEYESLAPPNEAAVQRLRADGLGEASRYKAVLAIDNGIAIGYAIFFLTYSSFRALPTMYLEDLYVTPTKRSTGAGTALFNHVLKLGRTLGCCRMDWQVLHWNTLAKDFYHAKGAVHLADWQLYRIEL